MATYYVYSGAGGTNTGADWTNAYTAYGSAVTAASAAGDIIKVHYTHQEELSVDTTYTFGANVQTFSVDKDSSDALTPMGTGGWVGNSTTNRAISIAGARNLYFYGVTFRLAGSTADNLSLAATDGINVEYESCYFWQGNTNTSSIIQIGGGLNSFTKSTNCTFRFANTSQLIRLAGRFEIVGGSISSAGSALTSVFAFNLGSTSGGTVSALGFDVSHITGNICGDASTGPGTVTLAQCKLGVFPPTIATQSHANRSSAEVYAFDCSTGDTHGLIAYVNPLGSMSSDTGIYFTSGAATQSWKITTTANANFYTPFVTPWLGYYNTGTSAITPYIEILRDGSATAYQDDEVWMDVAAKTTTGSTQATPYSDRMTLLGTPANQDAGAGTGSWTGEGGTAWSGKLALGSSITPAEAGHIQARIVVGEPSITVYADPQVRT